MKKYVYPKRFSREKRKKLRKMEVWQRNIPYTAFIFQDRLYFSNTSSIVYADSLGVHP